jgi:starch phosphorylase
MNEGHSAFLAIERVRTLMATAGLSFEEALEAARASNCFTTHTAVPAGLDRFDRALIEEYFGRYCEAAAIPFQRFLELGSANPYDQQSKFSMAVLAMTASTRRNAVSLLHGKVSQELFQDLWPGLPIPEVPVIGVTNGVHLPSWLNGDLAQIYDQYLQPDWRDRYHERGVWEGIADIPNGELWEAQRRRKRRLVTFVRERLTQRAQARRASSAELRRIAELLNPDAFTIGFARRFATYKRATLLFRDPERLRRMLTNPAMPVQILIAGKAHPKDNPGKQYIKEIVQLTRDPQFGKHIVFIEDYDIQVGRELYHGVDLWLNNPRRGEEACGTSGMKAGINGKLNLSVLDGWFDEAGDGYGSWPIGDRDPYDPGQDELHANLMYSLLETEILPMYYQGREEGVPTAWMQRVKHCLANVSPEFNCRRMIADYRSRLYEPAHEAGLRTREGNYEPVRQKVRWQKAVDESWPAVRLLNTPAEGRFVLSGSPVRLSALADLAGLEPGDVQVQAVVGHIGTSGAIEDSSLLTLVHEGAEGGLERFGCEFTPLLTGRLGFALRITPNHSEDPITRPCFARVKWAGQ